LAEGLDAGANLLGGKGAAFALGEDVAIA